MLASSPESIAHLLGDIHTQRAVTPLAIRLLAALAAAGIDVRRIPPHDFRTEKLFMELSGTLLLDAPLRRVLASATSWSRFTISPRPATPGLVFPPNLDVEKRWEGPHLVPDPRSSHIAEWTPGCVVAHDQRLHLRIGRRDAPGNEVISYAHLSRKRLRGMVPQGFPLMPPVGTFVEILRYRDGSETLLSYGRDWSGLSDPALPPLFPRPDRYIRRAFAGP